METLKYLEKDCVPCGMNGICGRRIWQKCFKLPLSIIREWNMETVNVPSADALLSAGLLQRHHGLSAAPGRRADRRGSAP